MSRQNTGIFAKWDSIYRSRGLEPRPIIGKACKMKGWPKPDVEFSPKVRNDWPRKYADFGIALRMGTPLPGGGHLGALDIDRDEYVPIGRALLNDPPCGRFGSKGAVFFVRVLGDFGNPKFKVKGELAAQFGQVAECLFIRSLCVIPPTIHPSTDRPYSWIGTPLHELDFDLLPAIGE